MSTKAPSFTFGIEEEYHLVDSTTRDLAVAPRALLARLEDSVGSQVSTEFLRSQIEIGTKPLRSSRAARDELAHLRVTVVQAARAHGLSAHGALRIWTIKGGWIRRSPPHPVSRRLETIC